jgi:hypothetical protein
MKRPRRTVITAGARRELEAVDWILAGEEVGGEHAPLRDLTVTLRDLRARPSGEFVRALDARAAHGFRRERAYGQPRRGEHGRLSVHSILAWTRPFAIRPAAGLVLALLAAVAVAVPLLLAGGREHSGSAGHEVVRGPLEATPLEGEAAHTAKSRAAAAPVPGVSKSAGAAAMPQAATSTRLVERTATLDVGMAPSAIESGAQRVFTLVSAFGGYVRQSSVSTGEAPHATEPLHGEEPARGGASFDIRVPSANLSGAIAALAHLGHVRSENNTTNDVSEQHGSLRSALSEAQAERSSVLAQLRRAGTEAETSALRTKLRVADARIARLQTELRALDQRVTYTSVALSLTAESSAGAASGDLTPGGAAHDAEQILDAALAVIVLAAAALVPVAGVVIAAWTAIALTRRRLREHALDAG